MLAPTVGHYQFVRDDGQPLDFQPGQFIQVHFSYADGTETKRSYSLATIHDHALGPGEAVDIAVSFVPGGAATALFEHWSRGDQISASGPYGRFCLNPGDHNARYLLIATGTGVTRTVPCCRCWKRPWPNAMCRSCCCRARAAGRAAVQRRFLQLRRKARELPLCSVPVAQLPAEPHPDVQHGYVQQALAGFTPDPATDIAYLCGNPDMVDACAELLKYAGLGNPQIRREKYVSSK